MYYPYLRARQFELIALRELAAKRAIQSNAIPILEPIKKALNNLDLANKVFIENGQLTYLILNPLVGEVTGDVENFSEYLSNLNPSGYLPAFHYTNNATFINSTIAKNNFSDCLLVCYSSFTDDAALRQLCASQSVSRIMVLDPQKNRSLDRYIRGLNKIYIRLDDLFEKQEKNANFLDISAHKFSEEHLYYKEDGFQGFSDFTVIPSEYTDGGSTPRAVAIHLTYINPLEENQVWIRHFTSETNDSIANVQGKFAEAANKAINFCLQLPLDNDAISELKEYYNNNWYPGLGTVKKISIKNHLLIINSFLSQ